MSDAREAMVAARLARGLSQDDLATLIGCSQQYISLIESGARNPGLQLAGKIADAVGCPVNRLFPDIVEAFRALINNSTLLSAGESDGEEVRPSA